MGIQSLKTWHWAVIEAAAGGLLGWGVLLARGERRVGGAGFISQVQFERGLRLPAVMGKARLGHIIVHPGEPVDRVTLERLNPETMRYEATEFAAPRPYRPLGGGQTYASVSDYLAKVAAENTAITVRYAWWDAPVVLILLWAVGGIAVIGGVWPVVLRRLVGAGLGREEEPYDLDRFDHRPEPATKKAIGDEERERLAELEAEMLAGLQPSTVAEPAAQNAASPAPPRELASVPVEPVAQAAGQGKEYDGQYYPVEKHAPHGFTLIEVLVVIGIIAILTSMIVPVLHTVRQQAQTVKCASQLKQIGSALQMYANANGGWLPAWSGWHTWPAGQSEDSVGPAWTLELAPFIGQPDAPVYNCPSFPGDEHFRNYFLAGQWAGHNNRHAMKLTDVTMTGRFVLAGDKTQRGLYPAPFGTSEHLLDDADPDDFGGGIPVLAWPWDEGGFYMHRGGNNILFEDMHVALFSQYDPAAVTFHPRRMLNWADVSGE